MAAATTAQATIAVGFRADGAAAPAQTGRSAAAASAATDTVARVERRRIVALGGGGFSMEPENPLLDDHILSLARRPHPSVCFVPTASADSAVYVANFYRAFAPRDCTASDLPLFERRIADLRAFVLAQDVVYVGGGSTANQQFIPALMPHRTTPACQASVRIRSRPWTRHTASRLAVLPPPT